MGIGGNLRYKYLVNKNYFYIFTFKYWNHNMLNMLLQTQSKNQKSTKNVITLELLDPFTCIINIPIKLSDNIIYTHQLIPSYKHKAYAAKLKMLNSLKRCFQQMNLTLLQLPNLSFKMFKNVNGNYNNNFNIKGSESISYSKFRKLKKTSSHSFYKFGFLPIQRQSIMHIGRWILTPHQRRTVEYFLKRGKRMIIGDDWNMGKTVSALACIQYGRCKKVLVIVPKILIYHWIWHINQLKVSLSKEKKMRQERKIGQICVQVLDFEVKNQQKRDIDIENEEIKGQWQKKQIKLKKQQNSTNNCTYYVCSYQYAQSNTIQSAHYSALILDQPQIKQSQQLALSTKQRIGTKTLKNLRKIQSILILKSVPIQLTRDLLPILNLRLDWSDIIDRYGHNFQSVLHQNQYKNAVQRSYYHSCHVNHVQVPGNLIKHILIPFTQISCDHEQKFSSEKGNGQKYGEVEKLILCKLESTLLYIQKIVENKQNNDEVLLICNNSAFRQKLFKILLNNGLNIKHISGHKQKQKQQDQYNRPIMMGKLSDMIQQAKKKQKSKPRAIICDTLHRQYNGERNMTEDMLYRLQKYAKIEYLQCCALEYTEYEICRVEDTLALNNMMQQCKIDKNVYINRIMMEGEYISSDDSNNHQVVLNPERYYDDSLENSEMIDQNEQKKRKEEIKIITLQNNLSINMKQLFQDKKESGWKQNQAVSCQIECQQIKYSKDIPLFENRLYRSPFNNNIIQICLDSQDSHSHSFLLNPHPNSIPAIQTLQDKQPNLVPQQKMDIQLPEIIIQQQPPKDMALFQKQVIPQQQLQQLEKQIQLNKKPKRSTHKSKSQSNQSQLKLKSNGLINQNKTQLSTYFSQTTTQTRMTTRRMKKSINQCLLDNNQSHKKKEVIVQKTSLEKKQEKNQQKNKKSSKKDIYKGKTKQWQKQLDQKAIQVQKKQVKTFKQTIQILSDSGDISYTRNSYPHQSAPLKIPKNKSRHVLSVKLIPEYSQMNSVCFQSKG